MTAKRKPSSGLTHETNETRRVPMFMESSDFDRIEMDPFTKMASNPKGTRVARCVEKVKAKGGGNPYAICQASTGQSYATGKKLR